MRRILSGSTVLVFACALIVTGGPIASGQEEPGLVSELSLTVIASDEGTDAPAGVGAVDTDDIDFGVSQFLPDDPLSAPLRSSPLRSSPLRSSPLRSSPLRSSPLRSSPLRSSPLRSSPLRSSPLRSSSMPLMPLSTVPLVEGSWENLLAASAPAGDPVYPLGAVPTKFAGLPLQAVMLQDVLALPAGAHPQIDALTIEHISLDSTPLRSSSIQGFLFAGPTLNELSAPTETDWCAQGFDCAGLGIDPATDTLLDVELAGVPAAELGFVADLPVSGARLDKAIVADYDVLSVQVELTPYGAVPVTSPLLPSGIVDCSDDTIFDCNGFDDADPDDDPTLSDAVFDEAILDAPTAVLRPLLASAALTEDLTFGGLLRSVIDFSQASFADVPLAVLLDAAPLFSSEGIAFYTASALIRCGGDDLTYTIGIPAGFRVLPVSTDSVEETYSAYQYDQQSVPGATALQEPDADGRTPVVFDLAPPSCGSEAPLFQEVSVSFEATPGVVLGPQTASFAVDFDPSETAGDEVRERISDTAPFGVIERFEPNFGVETSPTEIFPGEVLFSHIGEKGDIDRYEVFGGGEGGIERGSIVTAILSHIPDGADYDLRLDGPVAAPLRSSPLRSSPLRSSPIEDNGFDGGAEPPDTLQDLPLRSSPLRSSAASGQTVEVVSSIVTGDTAEDPVTLIASGYNGSFDARPYTLQVIVQPPPDLDCGPTPYVLGPHVGVQGTQLPLPATLAQANPNLQTLFLFNQEAFGEAYGPIEATNVLNRLNTMALRPDVLGTVLTVDADPDVAAAFDSLRNDACNPEAANNVFRELGTLLDGYEAELPELRFLTIVGDDDMIPFARVPDLVTLSNQADYYAEVALGGRDNPISAAYGYGYGLTDSALGDLDALDWLGHQLYVPELANGRIVETPAEITAAIDAYEAQPYVDLSSALVTGYDFLADSAASINDTLTGSSTSPLISETWTRSDLAAGLANAPTVGSLNAHFNHRAALPAAGNSNPSPNAELFTSTDADAAALPLGALLFSVGCQSGLSVPDRADGSASGAALDFAQVMARNSAGGYVANTGYGYGDTIAIAFSERLADLFAQKLDGTMTVGQALVAARKAYQKETPLPGVYDEKSLYELTPYGFPFTRVGQGGAVAERGGEPPSAIPTIQITNDPRTGFPVGAFTIRPTLRTTATTRGTFWSVAGFQPLLEHYRPAQPSMIESLPDAPGGNVLGDVLITGLASVDENLDDAAFVRPTTDQTASEPELQSGDVAWPATLATITMADDLALLPGQYRSDLEAEQRLFTEMSGQVLYPPEGLGDVRPQITEVDVIDLGGSVAIRAVVDDFDGDSTTGVDLVNAMYLPGAPAGAAVQATAETQWRSLDLVQTAPGVWTGGITGEVREVFIQAANDGRVGFARGKGADYLPEPASLTPNGVTVEVVGQRGEGGWFVGDVQVSVLATAGVEVETNLDGDGFSDHTPPLAVTGEGVHFVDYRTSAGGQGFVAIPIDSTAPTVVINEPKNGVVYPPGQVPSPDVVCADALSGIASCVTSEVNVAGQPGKRRLTATAIDNAGNLATASVTYTAHRYAFEGFFSPVSNAPVFNKASAGRTVPLKWELSEDGQLVTTLSAVLQPIGSTPVRCPGVSGVPLPDSFEDAGSPNELRFDSDGRFHFNWKTLKSYGGTCRRLDIRLDDGQVFWAFFDFRK